MGVAIFDSYRNVNLERHATSIGSSGGGVTGTKWRGGGGMRRGCGTEAGGRRAVGAILLRWIDADFACI